MKLGYIRVSSKDQNEARQYQAMIQAGVEPEYIYLDKQSGGDFNRANYQTMVRTIRQGDIVIIKSIDRLGRDYTQIKSEWNRITGKGAHIHVLDMPMLNTDQQLITGLESKIITDIVLSLLGYIAEAERERIKSRQSEGIAAAKKRGQTFGRPNKPVDDKRLMQALAQLNAGMITTQQAADSLGISRRTFYRIRESLPAAVSQS